jgi:phosphoribosylglycinamide formyltransferase 1
MDDTRLPGREPRAIGVLISGRGSNLQALIEAIDERRLAARIAVVISNRADAGGLDRARAAGIETLVVDHRAFPNRDAFDRALANELEARHVSLVCLAGFMRLVGAPLLDAQRQALDHGVKIAGATVHLVTAELDGGPVVLQAAVPVRDADTPETLAARILIEEHRIYPDAVRIVLDGGWTIDGRRFIRARDSYQTPGMSR